MDQKRNESEVSRSIREIRSIMRNMTPEQFERARKSGIGLTV